MQINAYIHENNARRQGKTLADVITEHVNQGYRVVSKTLQESGYVVHMVKHVDTRRHRLG
jgi:predicted GNAT superfamily acetyltransferase